MADQSIREHARNPQDLERLLVARQWAGDVDAMVALYEPNAVVDSSDGRLIEGRRQSANTSPNTRQAVESSDPGCSSLRSSLGIWRSPPPALPMAQ